MLENACSLLAHMLEVCARGCMNSEINKDLIRRKIEEIGMAMASINADIGISTLEKLRTGRYRSKLSRRTIMKLCKGLQINESDLFVKAS